MIEQKLPIALVVADRLCRGLELAEEAGIPTELVQRPRLAPGLSSERDIYTRQVVEILEGHDIDLVAMAGWMTVLGAPMFAAYDGRILNSHPSLLPKFKGGHAVHDALEAGATETGCTIHWATLDLDAGPIVAQERVPIMSDDTETGLHERIKEVERRLYPEVLHKLLKA